MNHELAASVLAHGKRQQPKKAEAPKAPDQHKKPSEGKVKEMRIRRAANGGYIARHEQESKPDEMMQEPEEHIIPDIAALHSHIDEHMGAGEPAEGQSADAESV